MHEPERHVFLVKAAVDWIAAEAQRSPGLCALVVIGGYVLILLGFKLKYKTLTTESFVVAFFVLGLAILLGSMLYVLARWHVHGLHPMWM